MPLHLAEVKAYKNGMVELRYGIRRTACAATAPATQP